MIENSSMPAHIDIGFMNAGKGGPGAVLLGSGRANDSRPIDKRRRQRLLQRLIEIGRQGMIQKHAANAQGGIPDFFPAHVRKGFAVQFKKNFLLQPVGVHKVLISAGGDHHREGDLEACAVQPGQGAAFAARQGNVIRPYRGQRQDQLIVRHDIP
jgi:hypothetical protein